mgnify:CR=1 FL=1
MTTAQAPPDLSPRMAELFPDAQEEMLLKAAMAHPAIMLDHYGIISDPIRGPLPFRLWDWQWELLALLLKHQRVIILKARQLGVSWLLAGYGLWVALTRPGSTVLFISRKEFVAAELLAKAVYIYRRLPKELQLPPDRKRDRENDTELYFASSGSKLLALASTKGAGRSESATLVIPDEWAFHPDDVEMYSSYDPTLGPSGQIVGCSTANGRRGLFYNLYTEARRGLGGYHPIFLPWRLRPDYTEAFVQSKRATYEAAGKPWMVLQEYPEDENSAFGGSLRLYFQREALDRLAGVIERPSTLTCYNLDGEEVGVSDASRRGTLSIWQPPRPAQRYVIGADVADSGLGGSRSAAVVLEARTLRHVATLVGLWAPYTYTRLLVDLGKRYNMALLAPERNNHGISVVEGLSHLWQYPNIYRTRMRGQGEVKLGWITTTQSRPLLLDSLKEAVADGSWLTQDSEWLEEAYTFEEDERGWGRAAASSRDDLIFAAGIAIMARMQYPVTRHSYTTTPLSR